MKNYRFNEQVVGISFSPIICGRISRLHWLLSFAKKKKKKEEKGENEKLRL